MSKKVHDDWPRGKCPSFRFGALLAVFSVCLLANAPAARCGTVLVMTVQDATVSPGGTGSLDIVLANDATATDSVTIGGFSIDLTVAAASGITFIGADDMTATPYIFAGNSLGFLPTVLPSEVQANDFAAGGGTILNPGDLPFGLAHVTFRADPGISPGVIPLSLISYQAGTSLSDADGNKLDFTIVDGDITVNASAVPEPPSVFLAMLAALAALVFDRARRLAWLRGA
jgi:hypothetical protein